MKKFYFVGLLILSALFIACTPATFVRTMDSTWNSIEVRENLTSEDAWNSVVDLIAKKFDIEVLSKEDGYLRTGWYHAWTGDLNDDYKVRSVIKFTNNKRLVEVKTEAQYYSAGFMGIGKGWKMGTDERLTTTLRTDIMGTIGRVAR